MKLVKLSCSLLVFIFLVGAFVSPLHAKDNRKNNSSKFSHRSERKSHRKTSPRVLKKSSFSFNLGLNSNSTPSVEKVYLVEEPQYITPMTYNSTVVERYYHPSPRIEEHIYVPLVQERVYRSYPQRQIVDPGQYTIYRTYPYTTTHARFRYVAW